MPVAISLKYRVYGHCKSAHEGWIHVQPGQPYVLSAYVKSDRPGLPAHCTIVEADGQRGSSRRPRRPELAADRAHSHTEERTGVLHGGLFCFRQ